MPNFIGKFADSPYPHTPYRYLHMFHPIFFVIYNICANYLFTCYNLYDIICKKL